MNVNNTKLSIKYIFSCNEWLINCGRTDFCSKPVSFFHKNCRVCDDHFKTQMFASPEKTRLLPNAVPTEFGK